MFSSMRAPTLSARGLVVAPHYLASLAGVQVLQDGGSAVDAAIAANAVTMVAWPHMCGLGGDLFAIVYEARTRQLHGLNASGRAPAGASRGKLREHGLQTLPRTGAHTVTVPGGVDGLFNLWERFGKLPMERLLRPAIGYARDGFPISAALSRGITRMQQLLQSSPATARLFLPGGSPLAPGQRLVQADLARSFELLASQGKDIFYRGELGAAIAAEVQAKGGALLLDDLAEHRSDWVEPISTGFRGLEVFELPPNSQGIAVLELLNIIEPFDFTDEHNSVDSIHTVVEAKKLAFADRNRYVSDPAFVQVPVAQLLSKEFAARRRSEIDPTRAAGEANWAEVGHGDTMYLCTADAEGNVVSLIQSLFNAFGSGLMVEGTGIVLQNRGASFSLDPEHVNRLEPRKRTRHTLTPAMAFQNGAPALAFGTRGADGQPQTQAQLLVNLTAFGMDLQQAVEAPRWVSGGPAAAYAPDALLLEQRIPAEIAEGLRARGHNVFIGKDVDDLMGTAQILRVDRANGVYIGGADPRGDSLALGY